jgi:cobalt/nickel transport system permease protein
MVGQLFLRSIERSERIYQAMQDRGYQGHLLTLNPHIMQAKDWVTLGGSVLTLILLQIMAHF